MTNRTMSKLRYSDRTERACQLLHESRERRLTCRLLWVVGGALVLLGWAVISRE